MSGARSMVIAASRLAMCALLAVLLLGGTHWLTRQRIDDARARAERDALSRVLPASQYDNDMANDRIRVIAPAWLGDDQPLSVWRARRAGAAAALVLQSVANDGYAGPIHLRIGIDAQGRITGVRVTAHTETAGLGDPIEADRSDWILGFMGRTLGSPTLERWKVRRDGGEFDQFAGATVTPRAVVGAVRRALQYVERHADALYDAPTDSQLEHRDGP
ncbi:MAG: electron transport complex subunit RsxG [Pseudomarimonas sp.]